MQDNLFHQTFFHRLEALRVLKHNDAEAIKAASAKIRNMSEKFGRVHPAIELRAFSDTLDCFALAQCWVNAVRNAESDSSRFRKACRLRAKEALEIQKNGESSVFDSVLADIAEIDNPCALAELKKRVLHTSLPFGLREEQMNFINPAGDSEGKLPQRLVIAFLRFEINGIPAKEINTLHLNTAYDIEIEIRISSWPKNANRIVVTPVSMEPEDTYNLPTFIIDRTTENGDDNSFKIRKRGRLRITVAASIGVRPFEFRYRARFEPRLSEQPLDVIGQRTLRFEVVDPREHSISGYAEIDCKLIELRNELRMYPGLPDIDLLHALEVFSGLGNLAGQALSDNLFPAGTNELDFQSEVVKILRNRPSIGENLEKQTQIGRGISDLSYHRIRIELKAVPKGEINKKKIDKFANQTAQYVVSSGKRIGILCVLDSREKNMPSPPAESHMRIIKKQIGNTYVPIMFLSVEGGLVKPSDLSR